MDPVRWLVHAVLLSGLRGAFRRVCWMGTWPPSLPDGPVIAYTNHHNFFDGHLGWLLFRERLDRPTTVWMDEWDRFPFFAAAGAQPFPQDNPSRRAATLRRTARRFRSSPDTVLLYYPGGTLTTPSHGVPSFDSETILRLAELYPEAQWRPLAIHVTWWGESRPTALLTGGPAHDADGNERERLTEHWESLQEPDPEPLHVLLEGRRSVSESWDLSFTSPFFAKYL